MAKCDVCGMEIPEGKEVIKEGKTLCSMCAKKIRARIHPEIGFLVVAPDRGFLGNEEVREAFSEFADEYTAELFLLQRRRRKETFIVLLRG